MKTNLRLLHRVLAQPNLGLFASADADIEKQSYLRKHVSAGFNDFRPELRDWATPRLILDHIAEHTFLITKDFYALDDFQCSLPPADFSWYEFVVPEWSYAPGTGVSPNWLRTFAKLYGCLLLRLGPESRDRPAFSQFIANARRSDGSTGLSPEILEAPWLLVGLQVLFNATGPLILPSWRVCGLDGAGQLLNDDMLGLLVHGANQDYVSLVRTLSDFCWWPVLFSLNLLNCKNIQYQDVTALESPDAKWFRRAKVPQVTFKSLKVPGLRDLVLERRPYGQECLQPGNLPLHVVRGHFKTYTEEKPLLGKHVGRYYWDQHQRGKAEDGLVVKDYVPTV